MAYFSNYTGYHNDEYHTRLIALEGVINSLSTTANYISTLIPTLENSITSLSDKAYVRSYYQKGVAATDSQSFSAGNFMPLNCIITTNNLSGTLPNNTYTLDLVAPNATYGFSLGEDNYYTHPFIYTQTGSANARITFNLEIESTITMRFINKNDNYSAMYGIFGKLDTVLSTSTGVEPPANVYYQGNSSSAQSFDQQSIQYTIPAGEHFIELRYRKGSTTGSSNSFIFKFLDPIITPNYNFADGFFIVPITGYYYISFTHKNASTAANTTSMVVLYHLDAENNILEYNPIGNIPGGVSMSNIYYANAGEKFCVGGGFSNKTIPNSTVTTVNVTFLTYTGKYNNEFTVYRLD